MSQSASRTGLRQWKLWSLSAPLITALLAVESCAVLLVLGGLLLPSAALARGRDARQHGVGLVLRRRCAALAGLGRALRDPRARAPVVALGGAAGAAVQAGVHHGGVRAGHGGGVERDGLAARGLARRVRRPRARGRVAGVLHRQHGAG